MNTSILDKISDGVLFLTLLRDLAEFAPDVCRAEIDEIYHFQFMTPDPYHLAYSQGSMDDPVKLDTHASGIAIAAITHAVRKRGDLDISLDWYRTGEMKTTIWQYASDNTVEAVAYGSSRRDMSFATIQAYLNFLKN